MVKKYSMLRPFLDVEDPNLHELLWLSQNHGRIASLFKDMKELQSVTTKLQSKDLTMAENRFLLDKTITLFPEMANVIGREASIVHSPLFESAVTKIQDQKEHKLTDEEKITVQSFVAK